MGKCTSQRRISEEVPLFRGDLTTDDTGDRQAVVVRNYRPPFLDVSR